MQPEKGQVVIVRAGLLALLLGAALVAPRIAAGAGPGEADPATSVPIGGHPGSASAALYTSAAAQEAAPRVRDARRGDGLRAWAGRGPQAGPTADSPGATPLTPQVDLWLRMLLGAVVLGISGGMFWAAAWGVCRS